jgi:hypothetical protein
MDAWRRSPAKDANFLQLKNNMKKIYQKIRGFFVQAFVTRSRSNGCKCTHCVNYHFYKWAVVMECPCGCHTSDGMTGHDGLCCALPNGLRKNNPYKNFEKAEVYRKRINDYFGDEC